MCAESDWILIKSGRSYVKYRQKTNDAINICRANNKEIDLVKTWKLFMISYAASSNIIPANVNLFKVNNGNTRTMGKVSSKLINNKDKDSIDYLFVIHKAGDQQVRVEVYEV